jgi:hypothetical protein
LNIFLTKKPSFYNKIEYTQTDTVVNYQTLNSPIFDLNKVFLTRLVKLPKKKFLTLRLFFHPKVFLDLEKMILSNTDQQVVNEYKKSNTVIEGD